MSSINSRVPPSRIAAIDSPADGEVAAYQASSGQFEWVANGSGGGGTVTSVALTETGSALTITGSPITGSGTINIAGAGTSSQVILGDLSLGTLTSGTVTSVSSSQAFITIATPTTTPSISIGNASASATGVLTATDWNTFNSKAPNTSSYLTLGTDAGLTNERVLTAGSGISFTDTGAGGTLTIEATGGGGSPGGSDTQIQYNNDGSFAGSSVMTFDDTAAAEQVLFSGTSSKAIFKVEQLGAGNSIEVHDAATDTTIFKVDQFGRAAIKTSTISSGYDLTVGGSTFVQGHLKLSTVGTTANPAIKWDGDTTTGINRADPGEIAIVSAGTETFRFGANNDLEIAGNAGSAGQVFTSGGAGAAASWTTPGGGIGGSILQGRIAYGATTANEIQSTSNFYFDGTNLYNLIGGIETNSLNIGKSVTASGVVIEGSTGFDGLLLRGNSSSGSISTGTGSSSNLVLTPSATGKIKMRGVEFGGNWDMTDSTPTVNDQVLIGQTDGSTAWENPRAISGTPLSSTATGKQGSIQYDSSYFYVCVATNTWKRVALSSW